MEKTFASCLYLFFVYKCIYCRKSDNLMAVKKQIRLEYIVNCSPKVLFNRLSTAAGLTEWFADDVRIRGNHFTFIWGKVSQIAEKIIHRENRLVRFQWIGDEFDKADSYFEFLINQDDLTNDVSLTIIDFTEDDEEIETKSLWDTQIAKLKHILGS